jgi:hypothetical protein
LRTAQGGHKPSQPHAAQELKFTPQNPKGKLKRLFDQKVKIKKKVKNKKIKFYICNVSSSMQCDFGHALSSLLIQKVSPHSLHLRKVLSPAKLLSHL